MGVFSSDTSPEVAAILVEGYRRMAPSEKLARVADLSRASRELAVAGTRLRYPDASEREIQLRVAALTLDPETMARAFGWSPDGAT